jgi:iron(III) transport system ATP-binding protein
LAISVHNISKRFGSFEAIKGISFEVKNGTFTTLLGPSGSGKTTILRCIAGVEEPDTGRIILGTRLVFSSNDGINIPPEKRDVGMVYQSLALWPHMTVYDNIAFPLKVRRYSKTETHTAVREVAEMLGISSLLDRYPSELSGGQQQRAALARALVYKPTVLLLDEPLSGLDEPLRKTVSEDIRLIQKKLGLTVLYVTHNTDEAIWLSEYIVLLNDGIVIEQGEPSDLLSRPRSPYTATFLGGYVLYEGTISGRSELGLQVRTRFGTLTCFAPDRLAPGESVLVGLNPNLGELSRQKKEYNCVRVTVMNRLGINREGRTEYLVALDNSSLRVSSFEENLQAGDELHLNLPIRGCIVVGRP